MAHDRPVIDFYFDFSSPYSYIASELVDALADRHRAEVRWRPILLGAMFTAAGTGPLTDFPMKGAYSLHDFRRSARFHQVAYRHPPVFPVPTQHAARAFWWLDERAPALAREFAQEVFRAYFNAGENVSKRDVVLELAGGLGVDAAALGEALDGEDVRRRLREEVEGALARGVFGAPYFVVEEEPFWGVDRLPQLEKWLASGGF